MNSKIPESEKKATKQVIPKRKAFSNSSFQTPPLSFCLLNRNEKTQDNK